MNKVKIKTLSTVHIGSGEFLHYNTDYVVDSQGDDSIIYVIDPNKMLGLIGQEHVSNWVSAIERGDDTKELVKTYCSNATPDQYALRSITNFADINHGDTLKEAIHDGQGIPYIPGSSIKGAIRTAVLASASTRLTHIEQLVVTNNERTGKTNIGAQRVEKTLFGNDPYSDIFRFLKVGDAYFPKGCEVSSRVINLNIRTSDNLLDSSKPQLVESIGMDVVSQFQMNLDTRTYDFARTRSRDIGRMPSEMSSIETLFSTINNHTTHLLNEEISFWNDQQDTKNGADDYLDNIKDIQKQALACKEGKECILRIGHASGWRFITGAWTEHLDIFYDKIVPRSRPGNDKYIQYPFPKSRRIDEDGGFVFGFVKLSLL